MGKRWLLLVGLGSLGLASCSSDTKPSNRLGGPVEIAHQTTWAQRAAPTKLLAVPQRFLRWYQPRLARLEQLYYQIPGEEPHSHACPGCYDASDKAANAYLAALDSSGLLSPAYAARERAYYRQWQDTLRAHPSDDGPPRGFEYDRIIYSQDSEDLAGLLAAKPRLLSQTTDSARVQLPYLIAGREVLSTIPSLQFRLSRHE